MAPSRIGSAICVVMGLALMIVARHNASTFAGLLSLLAGLLMLSMTRVDKPTDYAAQCHRREDFRQDSEPVYY